MTDLPQTASLAIDTQHLVKTFGSVRALDDFTLQVPQGHVAGFLGPNGAGKSTTIRVLLGILRADSGHARVLGLDPWSDAVALHRRIAYVPGDVSLWPNLTGGEIIDLFARLRGTGSHQRFEARRAELLERFELDPTKKARTYSKGNRQKVALVSAFASDAELFLLDEPTSGLDPLMGAVFTEEVRALTEQGRTVLLSSHIMGEVEALCDTVTIIRAGQNIESGTLAELRHLTRSTVSAVTPAAPDSLARIDGVHGLAATAGRVVFEIEPRAMSAVLEVLAQAGVSDLTIDHPSLEEIFLQHYGAPAPAAGAR